MSGLEQATDSFSEIVMTRLEQTFPQAVKQVTYFRGELTLVVDRTVAGQVCAFLRDDPQLALNYMCDLSAVDMWPEHPRFEVNLHLLALPKNPRPAQGTRRLRVKIHLEEHDARMPTLTGVWPCAAWYERETHELFGIDFEGHPDMRPLLLPDDRQGPPPLRRDVPVHVEEVAFSFNQQRIHAKKPFAKE